MPTALNRSGVNRTQPTDNARAVRSQMPRRIDYFDDPNAPRANSLVAAVTAVVVDDVGNVILQKRTDNELWGLPGGAVNIGESIAQAVVREVKEETALDVEPIGLVGIYSGPRSRDRLRRR